MGRYRKGEGAASLVLPQKKEGKSLSKEGAQDVSSPLKGDAKSFTLSPGGVGYKKFLTHDFLIS